MNASSVLRSAAQLGETALHLAQSYPEYFPAGPRPARWLVESFRSFFSVFPFWRGSACKQCAERCMKSFSCQPLEANSLTLPNLRELRSRRRTRKSRAPSRQSGFDQMGFRFSNRLGLREA